MGDFERTFGAGANIESIIGSFNKSFRDEQQPLQDANIVPPKEFNSFQEASAWAKENPGKTITKKPDGNGYIEAQRKTSSQTNSSRQFIISIKPGDIDSEETHAVHSATTCIEKLLASPDSNINSVINYISSICSINGITDHMTISSTPPGIATMSKSLLKSGWQLYPISETICLIDSTYYVEGSIDGALITTDGSTRLISSGKFSQKIYKALMGI